MRILHTMLRVGDMKRSVKFYTEILGMKLLRTTDRPEQKYSLAFVGYDDESRIVPVGRATARGTAVDQEPCGVNPAFRWRLVS